MKESIFDKDGRNPLSPNGAQRPPAQPAKKRSGCALEWDELTKRIQEIEAVLYTDESKRHSREKCRRLRDEWLRLSEQMAQYKKAREQ